ncbi:MAG: YapH protein, partial [Candidatus Parcubacteria bacterium]
ANTVAAGDVTNFDNGTAGQIIFVEIGDDYTDFDCTANANFNCGSGDIDNLVTGDFTYWLYDGSEWNLLGWVDKSNDYGVAGGADLAELYTSTDSLEAGQLVTVDINHAGKVKKTTTPYQNASLGIVSSEPGLLLGQGQDYETTAYPIALAGRVPVKVNSQNGPIAIGDPITSSAIAGIGMKATQAGRIIGYALENFSGNAGTVLVFVNNTWYDPQTTLTPEGNLNLSGDLTVQGVNVMDTINTLSGLTITTNNTEQIGQLDTEIGTLRGQVNDLDAIVRDLMETDEASQSSESTPSVTAISDVLALIDEFKLFIADLGLSSSTNGDGEEVLTIANKLIALDDATFSDVAINGKLNLGFLEVNALDNTIGIVGPACYNADTQDLNAEMCETQTLYFQKELTGSIDFFDTGIVFTPDGSIIAQGDVKAATVTTDELIIANSTLGSATLHANQTSIEIETTKVKGTSRIFITPTTSTLGKSLFVEAKETGSSFTVEIDSPASEDIKFDWFIVNEN